MTAPADNDDWLKKSFDSVSDQTKQLLTLSTGVLALTLTFYNDFFAKASGSTLETPGASKLILGLSWLAFIISIAFGLFTLSGVSSALAYLGQPSKAAAGGGDAAEIAGRSGTKPVIYAGSITQVSVVQWISFLMGLLLEAVAAVIAIV